MEKRITEQQLAIYKYIVEYMEENLISPSVREICQGVGLRSTAKMVYLSSWQTDKRQLIGLRCSSR